ncbi:MAG: hypothetical protein IKM11_04850 [Oscillospiraceae bacterium]|nr:hypothetical protein [Oscillospiraceae bacterium]
MSKKMRAVFSIVDYSKADLIAEIYKKENVPVFFSTHGNGSADSAMLELLGFGENKKSVMVSVLDIPRSEQVFAAVEEKMNISKPGKGIMFSVPLTGATAFLVGLMDSENTNTAQKGRDFEMAEHEFELIITIITKGYFPDVKAAANAAGARGGTLIHALGMGGEEAQKFLGIAIQPEKDLIFNVVRREEKTKIMKAIAEKAGINTQGRGIIFSLPVDAAMGLSLPQLDEELEAVQAE